MKLKEERTSLTKDLEDARNTIRSGGGLEADLENAREEVRQLTKQNASLERTVKREKSQAEYTRTQYQNASTSAAQSAMQLRQIQDQIEELKQKASGNASRLKELKTKNDEQNYIDRIEELESAFAMREDILNRKEEELRELKKNRPSTRATSIQPRSPKWTASRPASPVPGANNSTSRGGSALRFRAD